MSFQMNLSDSDPYGLSRAEWMSDDALFAWFTQPLYFPQLEAPVPCVLIGGRGTGKTTVLRSLSYEGKAKLTASRSLSVTSWSYYGLYHRVNLNRVTAFIGAGIDEAEWTPLFAHYINLLFAGKLIRFLSWFETAAGRPLSLPTEFFEDAALYLRTKPSFNLGGLDRTIERSRAEFENFLNDLDPEERPPLSLSGLPIDKLCESLCALPEFKGKRFFFILDEFENFLNYQQRVVNSLIKHSGQFYSFKVGVRELGWRDKNTLNPSERLTAPADYALIDVGRAFDADSFSQFAKEVCNVRKPRLSSPPGPAGRPADVEGQFPGLNADDEADLLGITRITSKIRANYVGRFSDEFHRMRDLEVYFADYWARTQQSSLEQVLAERRSAEKAWSVRYGNYRYSMLFTIRRNRAGLRKYYCGWKTFCMLADGNIRFLLELVHEARSLSVRAGHALDSIITPEIQTEAAMSLGRRYLEEMSGISVLGGQLTKLLLGLGRVFELLASHPEGHAPEINQIHFDDIALSDEEAEVLTAAIMHQALVRSVANKRSASWNVKGYDYALHPVFSAFFVISHRKKRKMRVPPRVLVDLIRSPRPTISGLLGQGGAAVAAEELPNQLQLFSGYYGLPA